MDDYTIKRMLNKILIGHNPAWWIIKHVRKDCKKYKIESLYDFCADNQCVVEMIDDRTSRYITRPAQTEEEYERWSQKEKIECKVSRVYMAEVKKAYIRGLMDGIVVGEHYLTDRVEWDKNGLPLYPPNTGIAMSGDEIILYKVKNIKKYERGVFLLKEFGDNIFHFTVESLSRLAFVDKTEKYREWPIFLDAVLKKDERNLQLIDVVNVYCHPIIWVDVDDAIEVGDLLIPPCIAWGPRDFETRNERKIGIFVDNYLQTNIRDKVLKGYEPKRQYKRVYIERGNEERLINENEIKEYLVQNGFEVFNPDSGDFWDEVDCFSTADVIVSCVGGALTNVIYAKKDALIYNICPYEHQAIAATCFIEPLELTGMRFISAQYEKVGESINKTRFFLRQDQCEKIVKESRECKG